MAYLNPALESLGYGPEDRVVITHADDLGMCHATIPAVRELFEVGLLTSTSVMVPCPWFPAAAEALRERQDDVGVHLTLNCEWSGYRWGPVGNERAGLVDAAGFFHAAPHTTRAQASADVVRVELAAQMLRARQAGIHVSHIDTHMGALLTCAPFYRAYADLSVEEGVPGFFMRDPLPLLHYFGLHDAELLSTAQDVSAERAAAGLLLFDHVVMLPLDHPGDQTELVAQLFAALPPGLTYMILHPAHDTPELRALAPDWQSRVANHRAFASAALRQQVADMGVHLTTYRALQAG